MTYNQEDKLPWAVGWCCFTDDNPQPLQDGTIYKSASYRFSRTTDIRSLFEGAYAQIPESEARQILEDRESLKKYEQSRFLVFSWVHSYPRGGWDDLRGTFATIESAKKFISKNQASGLNIDYLIVDLKTMEEVY